MSEIFGLMLVLATVIAIVMTFGPHGIAYLITWLKLKRTQLLKTKTEPTASGSQDS